MFFFDSLKKSEKKTCEEKVSRLTILHLFIFSKDFTDLMQFQLILSENLENRAENFNKKIFL